MILIPAQCRVVRGLVAASLLLVSLLTGAATAGDSASRLGLSGSLASGAIPQDGIQTFTRPSG